MPPARAASAASDLGEPDLGAKAKFFLILAGVALAYLALAKGGLLLASINPNATPIWPATGLAVAAVLLWGYRVWPAVFVGAFAANLTTAGTLGTSLAIAAGNSAECLVAGYLINRWSDGRHTFNTPVGVVRFAALSLASAAISATVGVCSLAAAGFAAWSNIGSIWLTWWLGDAAGAMVVTPVIVLWQRSFKNDLDGNQWRESAIVYAITIAVGLLAFSPLIEQTGLRAPLSFLAILPLVLAALRCSRRDTATVSLMLALFAVWGTLMNGGPFGRDTLNDSFLMLLAFILSISVPSLALSADVAMRRLAEQNLRAAHNDLEVRVLSRTSTLGQAVEALQSEVDERRQAEAEIARQRVHLVEAQRLANLGSWSWDVAKGKLSWSQQLHEIYGVGPEDFTGTFDAFLDRLHPEDRNRVKTQIMEAFRTKSSFQLNERIVRPDGQIRHLRSTGEVIQNERGDVTQMLGVCWDVTDFESAESALRNSEEQYRRLVDSVHDYAIYMLDIGGRVASWNSGAARIKGYSSGEIVGNHFSRFYSEEDRGNGEPVRALKLAAEGRYEAEGWRIRKDGSRFWASVVIDPIHDDDGTLVGYAKVTRDITERRDAQLALDEARERLAQSQKMEALGQLTGGIAHDFNNLLMIVSGHAQILRRGLKDEKQLRATDAISTAASRGEKLTRQLLAFSRRQPLSAVAVDLKARVEAVREMLGSALRGDIELVCEFPEGLWPAEVDLSELELALVNIVVNARDAMPNGGKIVLTARNATLDIRDAINDLEGDFVAVTTTDEGTGIPKDVLNRVFEPFFTTKAAGKGTGLGLSQVYGFAHQSGGGVEIASEVGRGTSVTLYLPRTHRQIAPDDAEAKPEPASSGEGTVLVVEDNADVASVTSTLLSQLGYATVHAQGADEALACLEKNTVDLVFSDIVMPGSMNGLTLAREIKSRYPALPVVLTSGYSDVAQIAEQEFAILRKPFQINALDRLLRQALQHGHNTTPDVRKAQSQD